VVGDVFKFDACELFGRYAARVEDKVWLADLLVDLQRVDDYGLRDTLIGAAAGFLPEPQIRVLIKQFWALSDAEDRIHHKRHWFYRIESLARQIHDAPLFERATLESMEGKVHDAGSLKIAEVYLENGNASTALEWLSKVTKASFLDDERDRLLLDVHRALGNRQEAAEAAWRIFRRCRCEGTFKQLLKNIGPQDRQALLDREIQLIAQAERLSYTDARFLLWLDRLDDAEAYILPHIEEINGDYYVEVLSLAQPLEETGRILTASLLYRALLESILRRAISKYYTHGVRYLRKLDRLGKAVKDWKGHVPHELYRTGLERDHARKSSFWGRYRPK
jgi:hypothetical protein